jgi:hypothetical protein
MPASLFYTPCRSELCQRAFQAVGHDNRKGVKAAWGAQCRRRDRAPTVPREQDASGAHAAERWGGVSPPVGGLPT